MASSSFQNEMPKARATHCAPSSPKWLSPLADPSNWSNKRNCACLQKGSSHLQPALFKP